MSDHDYIIVGAGSAGCVLANRLSADPANSVLLLEAGGPDWSPLIKVPAAIIKLIGNPTFDWGFTVEPDASRDGRVDYWPAGKVLGGSSSINGMLFVRGQPADYDGWAARGNDGWSYADIEACFRRIEGCTFPVGQERGTLGPQAVSHLRDAHPLAAPFIAAARQAGLAANDDYNDGVQSGIAEPQLTQSKGRRFSAADGFLKPVRSRRNLRVETGARVECILFEGARAVGVRYRQGTRTIDVRAGREVILSAGALQSPKMLMLSGIGPAAHLQEHGIAVRQDQPHVGQHLKEHPCAQLSYKVDQRTYNTEINSWRVGYHALRWLATKRGPAASPYPHAVGFYKSDEALDWPDVQLMFGPFGFELTENGVAPARDPMVTITVGLSYSRSEGSVTLRSADIADKPVIAIEMLSDRRDLDALTAGCRRARDIVHQPAFSGHLRGEIAPGADVESDEEWHAYLRRTVDPTYHPVSTCRMAPTAADGVVDPRLKVHGISGLRVVDASVFPGHVSGNTNGAVMMVAEKAAQMILEDQAKT